MQVRIIGSASCVATALAFVLLVPTDALAVYRTRLHDPKDVSPSSSGMSVVDIRSTTRRVTLRGDGHRYLTIAVRSYDGPNDPGFGFGPFWDLYVRLDVRGGERGDVWMLMHVADSAQNPDRSCKVIARGTGRVLARANLAISNGDLAWCTVPLKAVRANKRIRWDVISPEPGSVDRAPNRGYAS